MITNWCIYPLDIADQQQHIEHSERLLSLVQPGDPPTLFWSMAETTGLVLGFSQKQDSINAAALNELALPLYRRRAGGTAVLVGPSLLSLDVILPANHPLVLADIVESYRWFGEAWVMALGRLGILSRIVPPAEAHIQRVRRKQPETSAYEELMQRACYGSLSPYEVAIGQRKVVGFDMIRRRGGSLLQAGVLLQWDTTLLAQVLGHTAEEQIVLQQGLYERAVGLDSLAGCVIDSSEIIAAFEYAIALQVHGM